VGHRYRLDGHCRSGDRGASPHADRVGQFVSVFLADVAFRTVANLGYLAQADDLSACEIAALRDRGVTPAPSDHR
jgi:hypothetical protein